MMHCLSKTQIYKGQVEELVEQAKDEMIVLEMYLKERLWEAVGDAEIDHNPTGMDDFAGVEEEVEKPWDLQLAE